MANTIAKSLQVFTPSTDGAKRLSKLTNTVATDIFAFIQNVDNDYDPTHIRAESDQMRESPRRELTRRAKRSLGGYIPWSTIRPQLSRHQLLIRSGFLDQPQDTTSYFLLGIGSYLADKREDDFIFRGPQSCVPHPICELIIK